MVPVAETHGNYSDSHIAYPDPSSRRRGNTDHIDPHVVVLFRATGDLAQRKLLPGVAYLVVSDLTPRSRWSVARWRR